MGDLFENYNNMHDQKPKGKGKGASKAIDPNIEQYVMNALKGMMSGGASPQIPVVSDVPKEKPKQKRARVYTEEQKEVLRQQLENARKKSAETRQSKAKQKKAVAQTSTPMQTPVQTPTASTAYMQPPMNSQNMVDMRTFVETLKLLKDFQSQPSRDYSKEPSTGPPIAQPKESAKGAPKAVPAPKVQQTNVPQPYANVHHPKPSQWF